jgi:hypothetical protein
MPVIHAVDAPTRERLRRLAGVAALGPLLVSLGGAVTLSIGFFGLRGGLPLGYLPMAVIVWIVANHCFEVIEHQALGRHGWPALSLETIATARAQIGLAFLASLAIVAGGCWLLVRAEQRWLAELLAVAAWLGAPAAMALLAVTRSPLRAISPAAVLGTAARLGVAYVLLLAAAAGVAALTIAAFRAPGFVLLLVALYADLALGYLVGVAVYERRLALGVYAPRAPEALAAAAEQRLVGERRRALDHAYGLAARGSTAGALEHVRSYASTEADPLAAAVWLFHAMAHWENPAPAVELGRGLAPQLDAAGRAEDAAKLRLACGYLEGRLRSR